MIKLKNVTKKYGSTVVLEHCEYSFPQNGIVCIMGASGGGKTTLLNLLAGFDTDYEGEITVGNTSITAMKSDELCSYRKDNIGFVFQNYHLLKGYTVLQNVLLSSELSNKSKKASLDSANELLKRLGIIQKANQKCENLSGGQKQRTAIARALINNPQILFADEPTGALDKKTSNEIMELFVEIAKERLVIIITHDKKIADFADEVIYIEDKKIKIQQLTNKIASNEKPLTCYNSIKVSAFKRALKNFKVHINRYICVSVAISLGVLAFLFSLSSQNVMNRSIEQFKEKNTAFNNGYIKGADDKKTLEYLNSDDRIENVYYQYKLDNITLSHGKKSELMAEKYPTPKATESLSYGVMPRNGKKEISLSPSLAKKFDYEIKNLLGKEITLEFEGIYYKLVISGIHNAAYDDFFVSSDIEKLFYSQINGKENYSISYDVKAFGDILDVTNELTLKGIDSKNASDEVAALQNTFESLNKLFLIISILILLIGIFICAIILLKLQNSRYHEVGLLFALGFNKHQISSMITAENMMLCTLATALNFILLTAFSLLCNLIAFPLIITKTQMILSVLLTFIAVMLLSAIASYKLLHTQPAQALKK